MVVTILPPSLEEDVSQPSSDESFDSDGDASMLAEDNRRPQSIKLASKHTVVPGEAITQESQWMR